MIPCAIVLWYIVAHDLPIGYSSSRGVKLGAIALVVGYMTLLVVHGRGRTFSLKRAPGLAITAAVAAPLALLLLGAQVADDVHPHHENGQLRTSAKLFAPSIPPGALILSSGGPCHTVMAPHVAYNQSYMFYWLDRKGFDVCVEQQSMARAPRQRTSTARCATTSSRTTPSCIPSPDSRTRMDWRFPILATSPTGWSLYALRPSMTMESGLLTRPPVPDRLTTDGPLRTRIRNRCDWRSRQIGSWSSSSTPCGSAGIRSSRPTRAWMAARGPQLAEPGARHVRLLPGARLPLDPRPRLQDLPADRRSRTRCRSGIQSVGSSPGFHGFTLHTA